MSWRMRGLLVTIPVPRGRLISPSVGNANQEDMPHTNLYQRCSLRLNSFRLTVSLQRLFGVDRWDFVPLGKEAD